MPRELRDDSASIKQYILAIFRKQGKNFNKCQLCKKEIKNGRFELHHTKYEKATIKNIKIVCHRCNTHPMNIGLK